MFSFTRLTIMWRGGYGDSFEIGRQRSRGWKNFGRSEVGAGDLKNWTFSWTSYVYRP